MKLIVGPVNQCWMDKVSIIIMIKIKIIITEFIHPTISLGL